MKKHYFNSTTLLRQNGSTGLATALPIATVRFTITPELLHRELRYFKEKTASVIRSDIR